MDKEATHAKQKKPLEMKVSLIKASCPSLQILHWARDLFKAQVAPGRPDHAIQLGFVSLLIAIEDAAAAEILHEADPSLEDQAILRHLRELGLEKQIAPVFLFGLSEAPILGQGPQTLV